MELKGIEDTEWITDGDSLENDHEDDFNRQRERFGRLRFPENSFTCADGKFFFEWGLRMLLVLESVVHKS